MITVELYRHNGSVQGFSVHGHAGYAEYGYDIVCSAVSALTIATVNGLEQIAKVPLKVTDNGEELKCELGTCDREQAHDAQLLMDTYEAAISDIRKNYKQYLKYYDREV